MEALSRETIRFTPILGLNAYPLLYVDDSEDDRRLMELAFRNSGFELFTKPSTEGLKEFIVEKGIRLALIDLDLGGRSGLEVLRELKKDPRTTNVAIVMMTSSGERGDVVDAVQGGCDGYIVKPIDETIVGKIQKILEQRLSADQEVRKTTKRLGAGFPLFVEGELKRSLYLIKSGTVRVHRTRSSRDVTIATLSEGDMLGEEMFLTGAPSPTSATATSELVVLEIEAKRGFEEHWGQGSAFKELLASLSKKLRKAQETIALLVHQDSARIQKPKTTLATELVCVETSRLLTLVRMLDISEGRYLWRYKDLREKLARLAPESPLNIDTFLHSLVGAGFLLAHNSVVPAATEGSQPYSVDRSVIGAALQSLDAAIAAKSFTIIHPVTARILSFLETLHPDKVAGAPVIVSVNTLIPLAPRDIKMCLATLEQVGLIQFADAEKHQIRYVQSKITLFLKWQRVLMAQAPALQAA